MSEGNEGRDSENNWVIPSAESFPVETVGPVQGGAEEVGAAGLEAAPPPDNEQMAPDVKPGTEFVEGPSLHEEPEKLDEEQTPPPNTEGPRGPSIVGGDLEEVSCSSSDDDVEGLRKRVGRGSPPASVGPSVREAKEQDQDGGPSLNLNVLVIAAVGLLCVGVLVFSGGSFNSDGDPPQNVESRSVTGGDERPPQVIADIQDWIDQHADQFTGDPSSLQLMSGLLDRVAKENQEIRHMQATLQAQKEELEALLPVSDGRIITQGLAEENIRLKDALLKEETAHLSAKDLLLTVQEKLEVLESGGVEKEALVVENSQLKVDLDALRQQIEGFLAQKETLVAESQMLRQELDKQRLLVTSIRQELDDLVAKSDEGEDGTLRQERLSEMSSRLAMEAQRSESWEKKYVEHAQRRKEQVGEERRDHGYKEWKRVDKSSKTPNISTPGGDFRKTHYKHGKEHGKRWTEDTHPESQHEERRSKKHDDKHWQDKKHRHGEKAGADLPEDKETWKSKSREHRSKESAHHHHGHHEKQARHHQGEAEAGFHPRKGQKDFTDSHKRREDREKDHRHHDHNKFWKKLSDHQYRVPEGCSGLEDCARKDGVDLFNVELKPVQRKQFEEVLLNYLTKSQLSDHLPELTPLLDGFFEGPLFSHHKIRFKDFVDDVEDFLEDLARKEMGNDDIVDDFERYVYTRFFGDGVTKKRCAKDEQQKTSKCHKQYGKLEKTYDQSINQSYDNKPFMTDLHVDSHDFKPIKKRKAHENDKVWSPNSQREEESDHKYHTKDHPKTHHQSPKHNKYDKNDGSYHHHGHHSEKKAKPGREAGGQHHDGQHFHNIQYKEYGAWQMQNHDKHKYDPQNHRHQNTNKEQKASDERFGKESFKYKHKSPEKYKEDEDHKHNPKKQEKDAHNNHYQSSQRHKSRDDHSTDGRQQHKQIDTFHKNDHGPTQRYPSKSYNHKHKENEGRPGDYHPHQHDVHDRHRNYHQKHGKDKHGNYHQLHERSKDSDGDYHHKYDKDHHKHEDDRDCHHKYDKDHHKHEDDRDCHHKYDKDHHKHEDDRDCHHKYDKDHHKHEDDRDYHHKYDKDHHKHEDDRDYHHKYDKDHHKHEDNRDYHHKYDKDHHKHEDDRDCHHKYDKDHHKHEDDRDYHHKYDKDHHKHEDDRDYHHKYDKDHHKHEDDRDYHHKYDKDHHKHGDHRNHHKYDKDHHKHEDDRDYHHKYDKDHHKHEDDRDYHHKYDKDHHKHGDHRNHHKYDKDHHNQGDDKDYHHKYDKDHHKHEDDRDYHHKYDKDHHKHEDDRDYHHKYDKDHHKRKEGKDKHGNFRNKHEERRLQDHQQDDPRKY